MDVTNKIDDLRRYIHSHYKIPFKFLISKNEIENDLKLTGDDGIEFIDDIFTNFNVKCDYFAYDKYFESEGFGLIGFIKFNNYKVMKKKHRLTLGDVENAVLRGYWIEPIDSQK